MLRFSEKTDLLFKALSKAQEEIPNPQKTKKAYNYMYAPLDALLPNAVIILRRHGLMLTQVTSGIGAEYGLYSRITHIDSSQFLETFIPMSDKSEPQDSGSEQTYYRRYSLTNLLNLVAEDDTDGVKPSNQSNAKRSATTYGQSTAGNKLSEVKPVGGNIQPSGSSIGIPKLQTLTKPTQPVANSVNKPAISNAEKARSIKQNLTGPDTPDFSFGIEPMTENDLPF